MAPGGPIALSRDADPQAAITSLGELIAAGEAVTLRGGGGVAALETLRQDFLSWTEVVEDLLRRIASNSEVTEALRSRRYWEIHRMDLGSPVRPIPLIRDEVLAQCDYLRAIRDGLQQRRRIAGRGAGSAAILDTNIILQCLPPEQIDWPAVVERDKVRLIIPLRVIEELDQKKFSDSQRLARRARSILPKLDRLLEPGGPVEQLDEATSLEVLGERPGGMREPDGDSEIIASAQMLQQFGAGDVTVVTIDSAMRLRARAEGLRAVRVPEKLWRQSESVSAC